MNNEYSMDMIFEIKKTKKKEKGQRKMKKKIINIFGAIVIIISILLSLYIGIWLLFIGGIVQIINAINPIDGLQITLGILKILFASPASYIISFFGISIGIYFLNWRYYE